MAGHNINHASNHTDGTDDIQDAGAAQKGLLSSGAQTIGGAKTFNGVIQQETYSDIKGIAVPGTPASGYGRLFVDSTTGILSFVNDTGDVRVLSGVPSFKDATLTTGPSGATYAFGFYEAPATDTNLTQASTTQTLGDANQPYGAHAFVVPAAAGTASGGTGTVEIEVSGTSITEAGVRTAADTEVVVADITAMTTDGYVETVKKWLGQVTYTLQNSGGSTHTTFAADFNYGFAKYEDFGNRDFTVTDFESEGMAGAADTGFNIELLHHKDTGWTYSAASFSPGNGPIADMNADYVTEIDLTNGENFAYKRSNLAAVINGSTTEGIIARFTTATNNSIETASIHLGVQYN